MSNCIACHGELEDAAGNPIPGTDKLAVVLDNSNFQMETCQGCHVLEGINASPAYGAVPEGDYYRSHRAPAFGYLWRRGADLTFHEGLDLYNTDCTSCHGPVNPPQNNVGAPSLSDYHNGYDRHIYDANGIRYADTYTASIDSVTYDDVNDTLTIEYHASDGAVVPELLVSFYGWDTKDFIVPSHFRDADRNRFEYEPDPDPAVPNTNPLFTVDDTVVRPNYRTTANLAAYVAQLTDDIPTLIDNMDVTKIEVTLTPFINIGGSNITLDSVTATYDLMANAVIPNYFKGSGAGGTAIADYNKCNACHDQLAVTFHSGSGRAGEMTMCRNCHAVTNGGSHLEMQGRSIEGYVHAIHSFQDFDLDDIFAAPFNAVRAKRYSTHIEHAFPYFTAMACEACHNPGTYNVPDQTKSMPGLLSDSWTKDLETWYSIIPGAAPGLTAAVENLAGRNIGQIGEYVVGPASKACGGCHRAEFINEDHAGDLAAFNAHTEAFGTYVKNDTEDGEGTDVDDEVLFGVIDKIMTWFE
jgi:OmcA/MtrC family decaheme c-type cytochrome